MAHQHRMTRRVEFYETDTAGIVHFSNYFRYFESAEHDFFRALGLTVHSPAPHSAPQAAMEGWARVSASCEYLAPLRYPDRFEVRLLVAEMGQRSLAFAASIHPLPDTAPAPASTPDPASDNASDNAPIALGRWSTVRVRREIGDERIRAAEMPDDVRRAITQAPAHLLAALDARADAHARRARRAPAPQATNDPAPNDPAANNPASNDPST